MEKNIALIGAGYWGKNHLKNLYRLGVLGAVFDKDKKIISERIKEYPDVIFLKNDEKILNNPAIKADVIAAPAAFHYELAKKYLISEKDVLVEKPIALKVEQAKELVKISKNNKNILMVGHILQYHPAVIKLKELIDNNELGDIRYIYSNRLNIGKLRVEENVLWSFAPHDISLILMLMNNQRPKKINAFGEAYITEGIYDVTLTTLEFENRVKAHVFVSWLHPFKEQKLVVVGSEKMAVFDDLNEEKLLIYPHKIDFINGNIPIARKAEFYPVEIERKEPLKEELLHFIDCVENRKVPKTDGMEGLRVLEVLERAEKSLRKNR